jgi:K+-transporting ATPase KdpF subunit
MLPLDVHFCLCVGSSPGPATSCSEENMDYTIAGIASLGLFIYLIYALLRPEKF